MSSVPYDEWFDVPGALEYLKISKTTLYNCMSDGRLAFYYVQGTRQRRIKKSDLDALMKLGTPGDHANDDEHE